jgi:hypothetical protein
LGSFLCVGEALKSFNCHVSICVSNIHSICLVVAGRH